MMKKLLWFALSVALSSTARIKDEGLRWVVYPSAVVPFRGGAQAATNQRGEPVVVQRGKDADEYSAVLIQYDLSEVPQSTSLNSVFWYPGKAVGKGSNPALAIYAVENNWDAKKVTLDTLPKRLERLTEVTLEHSADRAIPFSVSEYLQHHLKDGTVSFLIEASGAPGFSRRIKRNR